MLTKKLLLRKIKLSQSFNALHSYDDYLILSSMLVPVTGLVLIAIVRSQGNNLFSLSDLPLKISALVMMIASIMCVDLALTTKKLLKEYEQIKDITPDVQEIIIDKQISDDEFVDIVEKTIYVVDTHQNIESFKVNELKIIDIPYDTKNSKFASHLTQLYPNVTTLTITKVSSPTIQFYGFSVNENEHELIATVETQLLTTDKATKFLK